MDRITVAGLGKRTAAFLLLLFAIASGGLALTFARKTPEDLAALFFAAPEDGNWVAVSYDGKRAAPKQYSILVKYGQVVSGYDGCNEWAYQEQKTSQSAERSIVTNLKECSDNELTRTYWVLLAKPKLIALDERQLVLTGKRNRGHFRRCKRDTSDAPCVPI